MCRCRRAIGRSKATEAIEPAMNTISWTRFRAPTSATIPAATAASATGPRKNSPGVKISPTASSTAAITQISHAGTTLIVTAQVVRARAPPAVRTGRSRRSSISGWRSVAVDEDRAHAERSRSLDVLLERVADHDRVARRDVERVERGLEDRRVRLRLARASASRRSHRRRAAWCATNSVRSRMPFDTSPMRSAAARSSSSTGSTSS